MSACHTSRVPVRKTDAMGDRETVAFDVVGTIFDVSALDAPFAQLGAAPATREAWFARLLDHGRLGPRPGLVIPTALASRGRLAYRRMIFSAWSVPAPTT